MQTKVMPEPRNLEQWIESFIPKMDSVEKVYALFETLGYNVLSPDYHTQAEVFDLREKESQFVERIYAISNYEKQFQIFLIKLQSKSGIKPELIRSISELFLKEIPHPFLIFTPDYRQYTFALAEKVRIDVGVFKRRIVKLNTERENAYWTDKRILADLALPTDSTTALSIYRHVKGAFSVERVTDEFFEGYKRMFFDIRKELLKQSKDKKATHDFTQQLLNRIMFLYFVARKRWLGDDLRFLRTFWNAYLAANRPARKQEGTFYEKWLSVLFFEAFNNKFSPRSYFPKDFNSVLMLAPYLNGGLFSKSRLDEMGFEVKDSIFEAIFSFFERYHFTIREELPLEEEVAVDPEMIGKVYESLVNLSETSDERGDAGIFYTDRVEIDFMSRRSLVEYFDNYFEGAIPKALVYEFVFAKTEEEKKKADGQLKRLQKWREIEEALESLTVVDPACGSGSFLVGMLNILADLYKMVYQNLGIEKSDLDIKRRIITRSLYGVDVMEWAVHVAELRLWLQLVVETELSREELKLSPLLPNLTFKIRPGDSLVEEIGGVYLSSRGRGKNGSLKQVSPSLKRKIGELKEEKAKFTNNERSCKYPLTEFGAQLLKKEELNIYRLILDERIRAMENQIKELKYPVKKGVQKELFVPSKAEQLKLIDQEKEEEERRAKKIVGLEEELEKLREIRKTLNAETKPFVWDIDFVEIFSDDEEGGFDIVIGNPPYVRQEKIADPRFLKEKITTENKKEYKEKLIRSVQVHFPKVHSIDRKSDLYVYFYFHGLALLNPKGTFCFITSNSWLDVGYGKTLQEFLLENVQIKAVYDNSAKRSFAAADVNTIIALFCTPNPTAKKENLNHTAKFVMFKKPFEEVVKVENLLKIEAAREILKTDEFRLYPQKQEDLLEEGWEYPEESMEEERKHFRFLQGKYVGNKWGGKYLRAPDIFFTILEKGGVLNRATEGGHAERERE